MKTAIIAMCTMLLTSASLAQSTPAETQATPKSNLSTVVDGSNALAADLYARLATGTKGNLFFSPSSIDTALAMTYAGAAGNTADQMAKTLHFTLPPDKLNGAFAELLNTLYPQRQHIKKGLPPAYQLVVANALWGQKGFAFKPDFTQLLQNSYGAGMNEVDFAQAEQARKTINDWVATQTRDKIKDLIAKGILDGQTRLVLTNAIYFKSDWAQKFSKSATADGQFNVTADNSATVPMMHLTHRFDYFENDDLQLLEMPYKQNALSMIVILPKKADALGNVEKGMTAENLAKWLEGKTPTSTAVTLPKFTFSSDFMLADKLKAMGMTDAFDPEKADFSGMTSQGKLFISAVIHKAFVAVDEDGTEAAAATAVIMAGKGIAGNPEQPKVFKADHPFIFLIRHNYTGEILFLGRLVNPKTE